MTERPEEAKKDPIFEEIVLRIVGRLNALADMTCSDFKGTQYGSVPSALKVMLILLTGILKAHGLTLDDVVELVVESYEDTKVTLKTPFMGKGGSA